MLKKSGGGDDEQSSKDKKKNKKEKGYNKIGDKSPDGPHGDGSHRSGRPSKPSALKKPTFRLPSSGKKEKQKSVKINEEINMERPRSATHPALSSITAFPDLDTSMPNISPLPSDLVVLLEGRPVFGQPLASAPRCHDTALPVIVRECIDYLEQRLASSSNASQLESLQGLYQRAADKVAIDRLKDSYERGELVSLDSCNPADVAGLLQAYLRSLPAPLLTTSLIQQFEHAADSRPEQCVPVLKQLLGELPALNRTVLAWLTVHLRHLCTVTSVKPASLALSLQTTLQMSHRLLVIFIDHVDELFPGVTIRPYVPQWVLCLPDAIAAVEEDLRWREMHLESLLARLADNSAAEIGGEPSATDKQAIEQSWEEQRIVTQLKRKLKKLKKYTEAGRKQGGILSVAPAQPENTATQPKPSGESDKANVVAAANKGSQQASETSNQQSKSEPAQPSSGQTKPEQANGLSQPHAQPTSQQPQQQQQETSGASQPAGPGAPAGQQPESDQQASNDNARVLYAELKDLFGLLKMMKVRNPQNVGSQSADSSMVTASAEVQPEVQVKPVKPQPARSPPKTETNGSAEPVPAQAKPAETNENAAPSSKTAENEPMKPDVQSPDGKTTEPQQPAPSTKDEKETGQAAELLEQRRSIQLAYLWLKIEEIEYQNLITDTEKMLEQERQLIKQLAGVITDHNRDPDTDSMGDSENGLMVPSGVAGSSMALVANDELADDSSSTTSDEDAHLNKTHRSVVLMRQNEKLERAIQDLERNVMTESEECLQLRVQLRFLELLNTSANENNSDNAAHLVSQMMNDSSQAAVPPPPPVATAIGAS